MSESERRPFRDELGPAAIDRIADALALAEPGLDVAAFRRAALAGLDELELKARVDHIARALGSVLPGPFPVAAGIVCRAAEEGAVSGWPAWPLTAWVPLAGADEPEAALDALAVLTRHASAEFAVRPFLERYPDLTWARLAAWAASDDRHLRRLASEGTRPRLPWAPRVAALQADPSPALALLDALREDPAEEVRRSVANHLGDLAKDDPELALQVAERWRREGGAHVDRVIRHGLRHLVKAGHPAALALLGVDVGAPLTVVDLRLARDRVRIGEELTFAFTLRSEAHEPVRVVVDYRIGFPRADGRLGERVFKLTTLDLDPRAERRLERRHRLRPVTTRVTRPGTHGLAIQANGRVLARGSFELLA